MSQYVILKGLSQELACSTEFEGHVSNMGVSRTMGVGEGECTHTHTHLRMCTYVRTCVRTYVRTYVFKAHALQHRSPRNQRQSPMCGWHSPLRPQCGAHCRRLLRRASNFKLTRRIAKTPQPSVQWPQRPQSLRIAYNGRISTAICQSVQGACDCDMREITKTGLYHSLA